MNEKRKKLKRSILKTAIVLVYTLIFILLLYIFIETNKDEKGTSLSYYTRQEIDIFNSQFVCYAGIQKGTDARQLILDIISSNATHNEDMQVTISGIASDFYEARRIINSINKYEVKIIMTDGIVSNVEIVLVEENE